MLPQHLIERALELTGKDLSTVQRVHSMTPDWTVYLEFSIEKFAYYLLSPEFIEKYFWILQSEWFYRMKQRTTIFWLFWEAIYEYQSWNEQPLIDLLEKI